MAAWIAFALYLLGLIAAFGVRSWLQHRATGDTGLRRTTPASAAEWAAQLLFAVALMLGLVAPLLDATGTIDPISALDHPAVALAGAVVALLGLGGVLAAQSTMGRSWRVGVDPTEHTDLVTTGVFRVIRNPVFTAMITASIGLTAMTPTWLQAFALASLVAGIQLQVRVVEEPYLTATHGHTYATYRHHAGRFLPGIGRSRASHAGSSGHSRQQAPARRL